MKIGRVARAINPQMNLGWRDVPRNTHNCLVAGIGNELAQDESFYMPG